MKKIFTAIFMLVSLSVSAVTVDEAAGTFKGTLNIGGRMYPNKEVYILPGTESNAITFVLPDFKYGNASLGNIVLVNIPMAANGQLTLEEATLYLPAIKERATINVVNGMEDGGTTYNSVISADEAQVLLSIAAPSLPEPIFVLFAGEKTKDNYAITNGGFEGNWSNSELTGWHSFPSATGVLASMAGGEDQFKQSTETRPGSPGTRSLMIASDLIAGVKANGNCTNGRINAGSTTANDPANNYNFSDPSSNGYNTPFAGNPDSIVFWAKYIPADQKPSNTENKARMHTVITTNARYQDPEADDYSAVKVASAAINYAATADMGWQRIAVPFDYTGIAGEPAYILTTFTTNQIPGGGSSYNKGTSMKPVYVLDSVYLDDVELIYNNALTSFSIDANALSFSQHIASVEENYCDSCANYIAAADGQTAQSFIAFDAIHKCIHIYVIADDFAQSGAYQLYRVEFSDSDTRDLGPIGDGLESIKQSDDKAQKVLLNGQLFIRRGDVWFNAAGVRVK